MEYFSIAPEVRDRQDGLSLSRFGVDSQALRRETQAMNGSIALELAAVLADGGFSLDESVVKTTIHRSGLRSQCTRDREGVAQSIQLDFMPRNDMLN